MFEKKVPEYIKTCISIFCGILLFYMIRANVGVTIVSMSYEIKHKSNGKDAKTSTAPTTTPKTSPHARYNYTEAQQGQILSFFYIGYMVFHLPGSLISTLYGYRYLFLVCIAGSTFFTFLTPLCAQLGVGYLLANRVFTGIFSSPLFPFSHDAIAIWVPLDRTTSLGSATLTGNYAGLIMCYVIGGLVSDSDNPLLGWPSFFYINGGIGLAVFIMVFMWVYDAPSKHPSISEAEKKLIALDRHPHPKITFNDIPFKKILTSVPFWSLCVVHCSNNFAIYSLTSLGVKYLKNIHTLSLTNAGFVMSAVFICMILSQLVVSRYVNSLIAKTPANRNTIKKFVNTLGAFGASFFLVLASNVKSKIGCVICMCFAAVFLAFLVPGYFTVLIEVCHELAAVVMGIANIFGSLSGVACSLLAARLLDTSMGPDTAWKVVFGLIAAFSCFGAVVFLIFGDCKEQGWYSPASRAAGSSLLVGVQKESEHV